MMRLQDIRSKYPQYQDMSDLELADRIHQKHYSDMPKYDFYSKVGFTPEQVGFAPENSSFAERIAPNMLAGAAQLGHALINAPHNIAGALERLSGGTPTLLKQAGLSASDIPAQKEYDYAAMLGLPRTTEDQLLQGLVKTSPALLMPGMNVSKAASAVEALPFIGGHGSKYAIEALGRILPQLGFTGVTSEKPDQAVPEMAGWQAVGETLPLGLKTIGITANAFHPLQSARKAVEEVISGYRDAKKVERAAYQPVMNKYNNVAVTNDPVNFLGFEKKGLYPESKQAYQEFVDDPTFRNLQTLQSKIGGDYRSLLGSTEKVAERQKFASLANALRDKQRDFLKQDPAMAQQFKNAIDITRDLVKPYEATAKTKKLISGLKEETTGKELVNILKSGKEKNIGSLEKPRSAFPEGHPLNDILKDISRRESFGEGLRSIAPESLRKWIPDVFTKVQNPWLEQRLMEMHPAYERLKNAYLANGLDFNNRK